MQNITINPFSIKETVNVANMTSTSVPVIGRAYLNSTSRLSVTQGGRQIVHFVMGGRARTRGAKRKQKTPLALRMLNLENSP
jgi:hypothetical protein